MMGNVNKTDKLDARGLAALLRHGTLPTVWIAPSEVRDERELPRIRMALCKIRVARKNRIHATLELDKTIVLNLQRAQKPHLPVLAKKLNAINKVLLKIRKACQVEGEEALVEYERPEKLLKAIQEFSQKAEAWLVLNQAAEFRQELLDFYFLCSNFLRTAEYFDTFYVSYFERQGQAYLKAKLFCLDPAPMLAVPLERSQSVIFFSATLLPLDYFMKLLTGAADHPKRIFQSPFSVEYVSLLIHNRISTK